MPLAVLTCDHDPLSFTTVTFELRGKFVTMDALVLAEERTFNELALTTADFDVEFAVDVLFVCVLFMY